jgi:hypothetical protein
MHGANAYHKATRNTQRTNAQKNIKTKEMLQKHAKTFKGTNQQWRSKKPWQLFKTNAKGAPTQ